MTDDTADTELFPAQLLEVEDSAAAVAALATIAAKGVPMTRGEPRAFLVPDGYTVRVEEPDHLGVPMRVRGTVNLHTHDTLVDYFLEHQQGGGRIYADINTLRLVAVINDDDHGSPDWRDHRAVVQLQHTPEWDAWTSQDGQGMDQMTFSEFLEQHAHEIVSPDAATMIDVARTFQAKRDVNFRTAVRPQDGTVQVQYDETIDGRAGQGAIDVPDTFIVRAAPFYGAEPVDITARLRYRISSGALSMGYALLQTDRILRAAFNELVMDVTEKSSVTAWLGQPPPARDDDGLR